MKKKETSLRDADVVVELCDDAAYFALVDPARYAKDMADWDYTKLSKHIGMEAARGAIVAWGVPEMNVRVRFTMKPLEEDVDARVVASISGALVTEGTLCFCGYTSLTMCAQFADRSFPQPGDTTIRVPRGTYKVVVHRLFEHRAGEQFADAPYEDELPPGDHYIVVLEPNPKAKAPARDFIPWAPMP